MLKQERVLSANSNYLMPPRGYTEGREKSDRFRIEDRSGGSVSMITHRNPHERARKVSFLAMSSDDCLVVTALDSTSPQRYNVTDFSSRAVVYSSVSRE